HRDVKPGNIMITQNGQVKVMDFGIARAVSDNSATVAETGAVLGTVRYFSPEQARGETVDARTDLYSTGVILFELLTGRAPFRGERAAAVAYQHISEPPATPSTINPRVSPYLDSVVLHALNKNKFDRYQSAAEFRNDVEAAGAGQVPQRRTPAEEFSSSLFGADPSAAAPDAQLRRLVVNDDERTVRTQARPPVAWIWAGVVLMMTILFTVVIWVISLPGQSETGIGNSMSVAVPDVVGSTFEIGSVNLGKADLKVVRVGQASDTVPEGQIIGTDPSARIKVPVKQAVTVFVSLGKGTTTVPQVDQQTEAAAQGMLKDRKLAVGVSTLEYSSTVAINIVISSDPAAGAAVREGDTVNLVVSNGLVQVPSEIGQPYNTAITALSALLLQVDARPDAGCAGGLVTAQSLAPGDQPQKSSITITYCSK
ncbi:MAG: PASTA domain-containing protein, partial [Microbacteriaceae bacterium]|nr:PASTA domain-containing protein [Microbacteriaceae bacterium]